MITETADAKMAVMIAEAEERLKMMNQEQAEACIKKLESYMDSHEEEMLQDAMALISINSEKMQAKPGKPFGEGTARVLRKRSGFWPDTVFR